MTQKAKCHYCKRTRLKIYKVLFEREDGKVRSHKWICSKCLKDENMNDLLDINAKCEASCYVCYDDLK